ncbi:MAG TPA: DUF5615 family PIN-like protein [Acidobacteriaceae bacterium]|nr:DUF5615 family PIN-like protein [Acidobacteriaceae bacterium]
MNASKRVLLDENLPHRLRLLLPSHSVMTVAFQGWAGISNGELIAAAERADFDVMVTADQGVSYQQNLVGRRLALIVLSTNRRSRIVASAVAIDAAIVEIQPGGFTFVDIGF